MSLEKLPRSVLVLIAGVLFAISVFFSTRAVADIDTALANSNDAKNTATQALTGMNDLKLQMAEMRGAMETNRKEAREDLNKMEDRIIRALKA